MPFLLPAITAFICDTVIIWLNRFAPVTGTTTTTSTAAAAVLQTLSIDNETNNSSVFSKYNVNYLAPLAGIRLVLLIIPLFFHSYTGTAVRYVPFYQILYSTSLVAVIVHMISLTLLDPTSIEAIFPGLLPDDNSNNNNNSHRLLLATFTSDSLRQLIEIATNSNHDKYNGILELRRIWWMLTLSAIAISCHWILLFHVRSTAPMYGNYFGNRKPSVYFAVRTASSYAATTTTGTNGTDNPYSNSRYTTTSTRGEPALMNAMNEFVIDMQSRLQRAKMEWSARLEDFGNLIGSSSTSTSSFRESHVASDGHGHSSFVAMEPVSRNSSGGIVSQQQQQQQHGGVIAGMNNPLFLSPPLQPFRILLQLFAYEDVLENRKLDALFDLDDGETVTFYVPQLLSFLLHGALYSSPLLEEWILEKCSRNVHFAHRCYWFLRAWCLEAPAEVRTAATTTPANRYQHSRTTSNQSLDDSSTFGLVPFLDEPAGIQPSTASDDIDYSTFHDTCGSHTFAVPSPMTSVMKACNPSIPSSFDQHPLLVDRNSTIALNRSSTLSLNGFNNNNNTSDKLLPEEREMIERLMLRVKECGEEPARLLEFGSSSPAGGHDTNLPHHGTIVVKNNSFISATQQSSLRTEMTSQASECSETSWEELTNNFVPNEDNDYSMADIVSAAESGLIPIHPVTGEPSLSHYKAISPGERYGFLPLKCLPSTNPSLILLGATEYFDKTPRFLDALIFLAESLFLVPREERKETLQHQLRTLECELLPSNSIYLPLGGNRVHHSVWRIVAEESIPISTKERVPCIVPLEVIERGSTSTVLSHSTHRIISSVDGSNHKRSASEGLVSWSESRRVREENIYKDLFDQKIQQSPMPPRYRVFSGDVDIASTELLPPDTEAKVLEDWIHGHRHPFRRTSLLDKVATTVKVPLEKMKTQVRDRFLNRKMSTAMNTEEMQPLSSPSIYDDDKNASYKKSPPAATKRSDYLPLRGDARPPYPLYKDVERGALTRTTSINGSVQATDDGGNSGPQSRNLSRIGSEGSLVSLGQWSSPFINCGNGNAATDDRAKRRKIFLELKRRLDNDSKLPPKPSKRSNSGQLPYGSDHEDDPKDVRKLSIRRSTIEIPASSLPAQKQPSSGNDKTKSTRAPPVVFRESWSTKQERIRKKSAFGNHPGWKLVPVLIKANDDLRQEQLACQLIHRMASILAQDKINVWLYPYEIIALTDSGGLIEAVPDTISLDSLKKNGGYKSLKDFFLAYFGEPTSEEMANTKANFVESLAAYSLVCFLLQIKDRHNGNILLDNKGHIIHIDFGFFFLSSPGKNVGFESAPFKLTREFVEVLDGPDSHLFRTFRSLCVKTFITLRRRCMEIILLVEMLKVGNEELPCFRGRPDDAIQQLRERFRLDLNDRACVEYVNSLIDASIENWRTDWYDRYQRYFVGIL